MSLEEAVNGLEMKVFVWKVLALEFHKNLVKVQDLMTHVSFLECCLDISMTGAGFRQAWRLRAVLAVHICFAGVDKQPIFLLYDLTDGAEVFSSIYIALHCMVVLVHMVTVSDLQQKMH